jgi:multiple sugar transport system ATP-binding protein
MNDVSPKDRNIAMVFQSYALYPHMSVYDNMAFSLKLKKVDKKIIDEKVSNAAEILELTKYLHSKPKELSGGQRQRVALGRAIVRDAKVFLMDEPLSNLDAKLRVQMRTKIIELHNSIERTTIYVTHDQIEAMTMASRIVVMKDGYIQQIGSPIEIYNDPANVFVGSFIGTPAMNFLHGKLSGSGLFQVGSASFKIPADNLEILTKKGYIGKDVILGIRPEHIYDGRYYNGEESNKLKIKIQVAELLGTDYNVLFTLGDDQVIAKVKANNALKYGDQLDVVFDSSKFYFFDAVSQNRIRYLIKLVPNYRGDGLGTAYNYIFKYEKGIKLTRDHLFVKDGMQIKGFALDYNETDDRKIYKDALPAEIYDKNSKEHTLVLYALWEDKKA